MRAIWQRIRPSYRYRIVADLVECAIILIVTVWIISTYLGAAKVCR